MVDHDTNTIARRVIQRLLNGAEPDATKPDDAGDWQHVVSDLYAAYTSGGTTAVRRVWNALCSSQRGLAAFLASDPAPVAVESKGRPPLPQAAQAIYAHRAECASWLDEYIAFAQQAAPKTPRSLHEAAGLFALSLAVGRRLVLRVGVADIYPNVFILWIGETTIHGKSTAFKVFHRLITHAGLRPLLLPEKLSPQALLEQMSTDLPSAWSTWRSQKQSDWLELRGLAAQRGWAIDEASFLFDSLKRDYNSDFSLLSYDTDAAGEKAARAWSSILQPHALRWRPYWDDPAAMLQAGADLRAWIVRGLEHIGTSQQGRSLP